MTLLPVKQGNELPTHAVRGLNEEEEHNVSVLHSSRRGEEVVPCDEASEAPNTNR